MPEYNQGRDSRQQRRNHKAAALAWLVGAGIFCLLIWAAVLEAIIK
jgi:hypothetical protein